MIKPWLILAGLALSAPASAAAESLFDALQIAYQTNPTLRAQRAALRAVDQQYVEAGAGYGPQVSLNAQVGYQDARVQQPASLFSAAGVTDYRAGTGSADLSIVQPLYTGGQTRAEVGGAAANVIAGREALRQAESQVLLNVVTAYVDVRRDRENLKILDAEIAALALDYDEIRAKAEAGALSKTDMVQADARRLSAEAQRIQAQGRMNASTAEYLAVVGQSPGELEPEPDLPGAPRTADEAFDAADHNNAQILGAVASERAQQEKVTQARAANGATVSLRLDAVTAPVEPYLTHQQDESLTAAVVLAKPIFTSGLNHARVREALEDDNRARLEIEATRRSQVQAVAQAWDQLAASRRAVELLQRQVVAEQAAVQGDRVEERAGLRSTIDLLNAELELANTRQNLVQSRHDAYVAQATLLSTMGLLELRLLMPGADAYRPDAAFARATEPSRILFNSPAAVLDRLRLPDAPRAALSPPGAGADRPAVMPDLPPAPATGPIATAP
jgi:TolC family type I secretion outer membrane protein